MYCEDANEDDEKENGEEEANTQSQGVFIGRNKSEERLKGAPLHHRFRNHIKRLVSNTRITGLSRFMSQKGEINNTECIDVFDGNLLYNLFQSLHHNISFTSF